MIYLLTTEDKKYLKIGYTRSRETLDKRLKDLSVTSPQKISIIETIDGNFSDEKNLHDKFSPFRSNGEWYKYNDDIISGFKSYDRNNFTEKKQSKSYQRLKLENKILKQQLHTIAEDQTSPEAQAIIFAYKFKTDTIKCIMFGKSTIDDSYNKKFDLSPKHPSEYKQVPYNHEYSEEKLATVNNPFKLEDNE